MWKAAAAAKSLQSCPTLCDPIDGTPPGSPVPGILQARTLEWVAISFSNAWKWKVKSESEVAQLCPTLRDPMDCSLPGSSIHGMFQARVLEWGAIAFSECEKLVGHNFSIQTPCLVRAPGGSMGHRINKSWSEWSFYFLASFLSIKYIPFFMSATLTYPVVNKAKGFLGGPVVQNLPCNAGDTSTIPGPGRSHLLQGI